MRELGHEDYNDNDIQVLEGLEAVRKRYRDRSKRHLR